VPAAAVIPAPIAYTNVVAVKKLVVGFQWQNYLHCCSVVLYFFNRIFHRINLRCLGPVSFTLRKLECSKRVFAWILLLE